MKEYKYVEIECENRKTSNSVVTGHKEVIDEQAKNGYRYAGYIPLKMGPSGKILSLELIFEKEN